MGKILLLVVIALVVYTVIKRYQQSLKAPAAPPARPAEDMVKCAHCHVNLPRSDALITQGEFFCTTEHQQLGKK